MFVRSARWLILLLPFLVAPVVIEGLMRWRSGGANHLIQPCLRGHHLLHNFYKANCNSVLESEIDGRAEYSFNEDGLRDRPRAVFAKGSYEAFGDSVLKGLFAPAHDTITAELERRLSPELGYPFLNAGLRGSGPVNQGTLMEIVAKHYPAKGVLVFLNGTDPGDDLYLRSQASEFDDHGVPTHYELYERKSWQNTVVPIIKKYFGGTLLGIKAIQAIRMQEVAAEVAAIPRNENTICGGLYRIARNLDARKLPYAFVFLPHPRKGLDYYFSLRAGEFVPEEYALMIGCAKKTAGKVFDLTPFASELRDDFFYSDFIHLRLKGTLWVVDHIENDVRKLFKATKRAVGKE